MITIPSPRMVLTPTPFDIKSCNYYVDQANVIVETIPQYLSRVLQTVRSVGNIVSVLIPKDG